MPTLKVRGPRGHAFTLQVEQDSITLGRAAGNVVVLEDARLSRAHAVIRREVGGWLLRDAGSRNGTMLNGRRVAGEERLQPGDEIVLGGTRVLFEAASDPGLRSSARTEGPPGEGAPGGVGVLLPGASPAMRRLLDRLERVAGADATVLLTGESGTGKELAARLVHDRSSRSQGPFVALSCPALPSSLIEAELFGIERGTATGVEARSGRLEQAQGGSLFLDEVGDLDLAAQAKLLRALQERVIERVGGRKVIALDVRVIAATNRDLPAAIAAGSFRGDLYHRLNVVRLEMPPLRERKEDIPLLVGHFLKRASPAVELGPGVLEVLCAYHFPGNVRELEHMLEQACLLCADGVLRAHDLPAEVQAPRRDAPAESDDPATDDTVQQLYRRIVTGHESFWDAAAGAYLRREVSRDAMRSLIRRGFDECRGSYKALAEHFGLASDYKRLLNFLNYHELGVAKTSAGKGRRASAVRTRRDVAAGKPPLGSR